MIFVTVGEQLPFDRLIRAMDEWAATSGQDVFAQTGNSKWKPAHMPYKEFLDPVDFKERLQSADLVVAHAGMGTIITALEVGKPILVVPRQQGLGEVRNDHQFATARRFQSLDFVEVAIDTDELKIKLDDRLRGGMAPKKRGFVGPDPLLIATIREFVSKS